MMTDIKVALITGSAKRVGATVAQSLHQQGWRIIVHYHSSKREALSFVDKLNEIKPHSAVALGANLSSIHEVKELAKQALSTWGHIDLLINNASSFYPTPLEKASEEDWDTLINSNAKAAFFLAQGLLSSLLERQGSIINMVDIHADRPLLNHPIYTMAKAALVALTKALARDLAPHIRVNAIAPGIILWPDDNEDIDEKTRLALVNRIPLKRHGNPDDIAKTVSFLLENTFVNGQIIAIDGGRTVVP